MDLPPHRKKDGGLNVIDDSEYTSTENVVCPYCFEEDIDSWDAAESSNRRQCEHCEKYFAYDSETWRTFTSRPIDCLNDETLHDWKDAGCSLKRCKKCDERRKMEV